MPREVLIALCLVLIFEGLLLFAIPGQWQKMMIELAQQPPRHLRAVGGVVVIVGLILLQAVVD
jgi:uncharacterized protein YjeT (DUF2065 family)